MLGMKEKNKWTTKDSRLFCFHIIKKGQNMNRLCKQRRGSKYDWDEGKTKRQTNFSFPYPTLWEKKKGGGRLNVRSLKVKIAKVWMKGKEKNMYKEKWKRRQEGKNMYGKRQN